MRIVRAGEAVEVSIDDRGSAVGGVGTEVARQKWHGGGLEELASIHGGFLPDGRDSLIQETARADTLWASVSEYHTGASPGPVGDGSRSSGESEDELQEFVPSQGVFEE